MDNTVNVEKKQRVNFSVLGHAAADKGGGSTLMHERKMRAQK